MLMAFVSMMDEDTSETCVRGNGKTASMTFYLYRYKLLGKTIWTNYYTTFSDEIMGFQQMITRIKELKKNNQFCDVILGVTEMQKLINSIGSSTQETLFVDDFVSELRKLNADCFYDTQIFKSVHIRLRRHTENVRIPLKYHLTGEQCNYDRCEKKHIIKIYSQIPWKDRPIKIFKAWEVGKLYRSTEMIEDILLIPKKQKETKEEKIL
jgi:hypothetical protein